MERLQVILELITGQYKREAKEAATATAQIGTSAKTAGADTTKSLSAANQQVSAFKGLVAGAAVGAVVAFGKATINAASNLQESMNAVNVVFGDAAEGIHALGEDAVDSFGLSQRAFNEFSVRFSAFADNIAGSSGRDVVEVVDEMTTRIADFASVHNVTMEEAATIAQSTLAGETEAFRRFGGDVSAAAVELKGMELGLGDTSAELSEQEKILIRYELFMEQTAKTAGDFANTQDSLANQQRTLTANFEDFQAMLGQLVIPVLSDSIGQLNQMLDVLNLIADVLPGAEGGTVSFGGAISGALQFLNPLTPALQAAENWLAIFKKSQEDAAAATEATTTSLSGGQVVLDAYNAAAQPLPGLIDMVTVSQETGLAVLDKYNEMGREGARAVDDHTDSIEANIDALNDQQDQMRAQTDPLFALFDATNKQREAQDKLNALVADGVKSGPEYEQALADVATAAFDVRDAQAEARVATDLTKEEFIKQAENADIARDKAEELADVLYGLSGLRLDPIQLAVEIRELRRSAGSQAGGVQEYHTGGTVTGGNVGDEVFIRALVGETIVPIGHNAPLAPATSPMSAGVTIGAVYAMGTPAHIAHDVGQQVALEVRMA